MLPTEFSFFMEISPPMTNSPIYFSHQTPTSTKTYFNSLHPSNVIIFPKTLSYPSTALHKTNQNSVSYIEDDDTNVVKAASFPTMSDILESSRAQNLDLQLQTLGPLFRITAKSLETQRELGRAEGLIRVWLEGKILHLDSIRLSKETMAMKRSIFGIGLFIGAVAIRYGYDCGCRKAELLAINDSDLYHSKLVKYYKRVGFKPVYEVTGSSMGDLLNMLVWGGVGTRMDANVEELLIKWCYKFKSKS